MKNLRTVMRLIDHRTQSASYIMFPPLLLIILVVALLTLTASVCFRSTKGLVSTKALLLQLQRLQARFYSGKVIDPDKEREEMEKLQNKIKTTSDATTISANAALKRLFESNCEYIQSVLQQPGLTNRMSWIKLNGLMMGFDSHFFPDSSAEKL